MVPLTKEYWERVVGFCVGEIGAGRTPNPDVLCNSRIKFGAFMDHLSSLPSRFDRVASGHYARVQRLALPDGSCVASLHACADADKDQTYFLGALSAAQLSRAMFPLGGLKKSEVRELAAAGGLPPAGRKDSQGICFLGKVKFSEFVESHLGKCPGALVELESGERLGQHAGVWFHTLGQRSGIKLSGGPWYVAAKDPTRNLVYVSRSYHDERQQQRRAAFRCGSFSWLGDARPQAGSGTGLRCKVRHGPASYACRLQWEAPWEADRVTCAPDCRATSPSGEVSWPLSATVVPSSIR